MAEPDNSNIASTECGPPVEIKEELPDQIETALDAATLSNEEDGDDDDVIIVDVDKTMRFLSGEISFGEYTATLDQTTVQHPPETAASATASEGSPGSPRLRMRKHKQLPPNLRGLMGEANIKCARGEYDEAVKMCEWIIRSAPHFADPFQTLADIYDAKGDNDRRMQCQLIAAHLKHTDSEDWFTLGQEFHELNNLEQALFCYERATRLEPQMLDYWLAKSELLQIQGDMKRVMDCRCHILYLTPPSAGLRYLELARELTRWYNDAGDIDRALGIMLTTLEKHPDIVTPEDINCLLDLYFVKGIYDLSLLVLVQHSGGCLYFADGVCLKSGDKKSALTLPDSRPIKCSVPEDMKVDLKAKMIICLIRLGYIECFAHILDEICSESPENIGDLYLDIAEAFVAVGYYASAKPLLHSLVMSASYDMPVVWLRYAECLGALGDMVGAVSAYQRVIDLAPGHFAARLSLSALHQQLGRPDEAVTALLPQPLTDGENEETNYDVRLMLPCCNLLYIQEKYEEFIVCAKAVLFSFCQGVFEKRHLRAIAHSRAMKSRFAALRAVGSQIEKSIKAAAKLDSGALTADDLWDLYLKLCYVLTGLNKLDIFENVSILALLCPQFMYEPDKAALADFICLTACILNHNGPFAYGIARSYCLKNLNSNCAWNVFNQIILLSQDMRHNRFCLRLAMKHADHHALGILNGNSAMIAGSYKHAIGEYTSSLKQNPSDPLLYLLIGLVFLHMSCQKFSLKRHLLVTQSCAFLNQYLELRGECQESYYNLGRAMHQIGLYHAAIHYYNKALSMPVPVSECDSELFDLRRDTAFNLHLLYTNSGSHELAHHILQQYLVI